MTDKKSSFETKIEIIVNESKKNLLYKPRIEMKPQIFIFQKNEEKLFSPTSLKPQIPKSNERVRRKQKRRLKINEMK